MPTIPSEADVTRSSGGLLMGAFRLHNGDRPGSSPQIHTPGVAVATAGVGAALLARTEQRTATAVVREPA